MVQSTGVTGWMYDSSLQGSLWIEKELLKGQEKPHPWILNNMLWAVLGLNELMCAKSLIVDMAE